MIFAVGFLKVLGGRSPTAYVPRTGILGRLSVLSSGGSRKPAQEQSNREPDRQRNCCPFHCVNTIRFCMRHLSYLVPDFLSRSRLSVQLDAIRKWRTHQLTRHQHAHRTRFLVPALASRVGKRLIMARDEIIRLIRRKDFGGFRFFTADARACFSRNVMKNDPRHPGLIANLETSIEPD